MRAFFLHVCLLTVGLTACAPAKRHHAAPEAPASATPPKNSTSPTSVGDTTPAADTTPTAETSSANETTPLSEQAAANESAAPSDSNSAAPSPATTPSTATIPAMPPTADVAVSPEPHPAPGVLAHVADQIFETLARDYQIHVSTGPWISYPLWISFRIYSNEQRNEIRGLLDRLRVAESTRLRLARDGFQPESAETLAKIDLDLRHVRRMVGWLNTDERLRAENTTKK